jgi:hypothetical protein
VNLGPEGDLPVRPRARRATTADLPKTSFWSMLPAMSAHSEPPSVKSSKRGVVVLGRSLATGRVVLKPASKPGVISLKAAKKAVREVSEKEKK